MNVLHIKIGKWRGTVDVAIKQLKNLNDDRMSGRRAIEGFEKAREEFFKECNILRILHHPHLVQVRLYIVMFIDYHVKLQTVICMLFLPHT